MMWQRASVAARDGAYGVKPRRRIVVSLTAMLTILPCPASSMCGTTARATRMAADDVGGERVAEAVRADLPEKPMRFGQSKCGFTVRMPMPGVVDRYVDARRGS